MKNKTTNGSYRKPSVIINLASGRTSDVSDEMRKQFAAYGLPPPHIHLLSPENITSCLERISKDGTDLLVVFGGDGTCMAGAAQARSSGIPLVALPGGTMNMLPKSLYRTDNWQKALSLALSRGRTRWQTAGNINGHLFYCGAIIGDPVVMSEARESLRDGDVLNAVKRVPEIISAISDGSEFRYEVDGTIFDAAANALHIYCPAMSKGAKNSDTFEIASAPQLTLTRLFGVGAIALADDWRTSPDIFVTEAKSVKVSGCGSLNILLDGEPKQLDCPISIHLETKGVRVLAPKFSAQ